MPQDLISVGGRGINLAQVVRWFSRLEQQPITDEAEGEHLAAGVDQFDLVETVYVEYVNGKSDTFVHEEAVALRTELERQSRGLMQPPGEGIS